MKKRISLLIVVVMVLSMCTVGFAATAATEDVSVSSKKQLYEQYKAAVEEAIATYDARIELDPFEEFDFDTAAPIDEFRATLKAIGEHQKNAPKIDMSRALTPEENKEKISKIQPMGWQEHTKSDYVAVGTRSIPIYVTAQIETYYSSSHDRQLISSNSYVDDEEGIKSGTAGYKWITNFLDYRVIDGGRTFYVVAQGLVEYSGMIWWDLNISVEFYCSPTGKIS